MNLRYLLDWFVLKNKKPNLPLPRTGEEVGDYIVNFERAASFTTSCGFPVGKISWRDGDVLDKSGHFVKPAMLAAESRRIANRRKDFLHKTTTDLVKRYGLIATEQLNVKNMTASGGEYKKGLNRSILDTAPSTFLNLLKVKAEEAGLLWVEVPTRQVKPSQTCHRCGIQRKKSLAEREHRCGCGASCSRDENAARVMLNWALVGNVTGQELPEVGSGCGLAAKIQETHVHTAQAD